jgi:hypothetical protein
MGGSTLDIDIVNADTSTCNNFELLCRVEQVGCHLSLRTDDESFIVANNVFQLFRTQTFLLVYLKLVLK